MRTKYTIEYKQADFSSSYSLVTDCEDDKENVKNLINSVETKFGPIIVTNVYKDVSFRTSLVGILG